jgi:hypothetical protein
MWADEIASATQDAYNAGQKLDVCSHPGTIGIMRADGNDLQLGLPPLAQITSPCTGYRF